MEMDTPPPAALSDCDALGSRGLQPEIRPKQTKLTTHDYQVIGVDALKDARTVQNWWEGKPVTDSTRIACERACDRLGYPRPPHAR